MILCAEVCGVRTITTGEGCALLDRSQMGSRVAFHVGWRAASDSRRIHWSR